MLGPGCMSRDLGMKYCRFIPVDKCCHLLPNKHCHRCHLVVIVSFVLYLTHFPHYCCFLFTQSILHRLLKAFGVIHISSSFFFF